MIGAARDAEHLLDLVEQLERLPAGRSSLLMKVTIGMPRIRQTWKSLMVCGSTPLALSISMTARVGGGERAVGVLAEVVVAGRVEQVDATARVLELQHARRDRDAALLLHLHPVAGGLPAPCGRLDRAGEVDRAAVEQQLLGQRRLARVGVRDDRERPPLRDFSLYVVFHVLLILAAIRVSLCRGGDARWPRAALSTARCARA